MSPELSRQTRLIVVAVVVIAAILMLAVVPFIVAPLTDNVQHAQIAKYEKLKALNDPQAPLIKPAATLIGWTFPLWMSLTMIAGAMLLAIAKYLYDGEKWARALTLFCLSIPSIAGAYMMVPFMNFIGKGVPPSISIMAIGLIPYFTVLLVNKSDWKQKLVDFWVFLLLGVTAAEAWSDGHAADRILSGHPLRPLYADGMFVLAPSRNLSWIALVILVVAIYLLAMRKRAGWFMGIFGGSLAIIAGYSTHYFRHATNDYLYLGLMGTALVVSLVVPAIRTRLIDEVPAGKNTTTGVSM